MIILAIDQSLSVTGVAIGSSSDDMRGGYKFGAITTPKTGEMTDRLAHLFRELDRLIREHSPTLICFEEPFFPVGGNAFSPKVIGPLQMAAGCVLTIAGLWKIPVEQYRAEDWRQTVIGFSRAPKGLSAAQRRKFLKDAVANRMKALGYVISKDDQSDALGILVHGMTVARNKRSQGNLLDLARRA